MKELTWKPVLSNLTEALGELDDLHQCLHFLSFGELPEDNPPYRFDEQALFFGLKHVYHHLNRAWDCRHTPEDRAWRFTEKDGRRWTRFPDTAAFADLWPSDRTIKGHVGDLCREVNLTPVRLFVYMAYRKLRILCYLVAKELGEEWKRPQGLFPEVGAQPLTEKDFVRCIHRIYVELNMAWNSRRDKTFATDKHAMERRRLFPMIFTTVYHTRGRSNG